MASIEGGPIDDRNHVLATLNRSPFLEHTDDHFWNGRIFSVETVEKPRATWQSTHKPRDDHDAPEWLTASEFLDSDAVADLKISQLAELLKMSKKTVVYSGAGISRAAGIGQAARGGEGGRGNKTTTADPTATHYALASLSKAGLIHGWVQQNHDGLPQKAGFPQERINEVHGSWYDPSNPVVVYSGNLKTYEFEWMEKDANTCDLALVMGTSLGGLNADQVAIKAAMRSLEGKSLGMVLINLQQTRHDGESTLRLFGKTDDVLASLLSKLGIPEPVQKLFIFEGPRKVLVPYDEDGNRSNTIKTWWDLTPGAEIRLNPNHNIQGAKQPIYMHIGAKRARKINGEWCEKGKGHGVVMRWSNKKVGIDLKIDGAHFLLGQWWLDAAVRGGPPSIPVVNLRPVISLAE